MPTFALMTKLAPEEVKNPSLRAQRGRRWMARVRAKCPGVKWIAHYATLGPYDFLDIYEAPNEEVAAKVSMLTLASGASAAESWTLIPYDRFLKLTKSL
jgi:uncharacterized protein with GYD domain